jgi:hypothetical protein
MSFRFQAKLNVTFPLRGVCCYLAEKLLGIRIRGAAPGMKNNWVAVRHTVVHVESISRTALGSTDSV